MARRATGGYGESTIQIYVRLKTAVRPHAARFNVSKMVPGGRRLTPADSIIRRARRRLSTQSGSFAPSDHSYFSASTGTSVAARKAGYSPDSSPISEANTVANSGSHSGV
jgi:hypothetical protein